jgi:hypothetical protein
LLTRERISPERGSVARSKEDRLNGLFQMGVLPVKK